MSDLVEVDSARLSDLSLMGWLFVGVGAVGVGVVVQTVVEWAVSGADPSAGFVGGGILVIVGAGLAYIDAMPEWEGNCENCGEHVRTHSSRDGADEVVRVEATGTPRRASIGPFSVVVQRRKCDRLYCSGECADEDTVVLTGPHDHETAATTEVSDRAT